MQKCSTPLSVEFMSDKNLDVIQRRLAQQVKSETGKTISRQSDVELRGIMESVFEAFGDISGGKKEIRRLNDVVLDIVVKQVVAGIESYLMYLKDASTLPEPLSRGTFASMKGERNLQYRAPGVPGK